MLPESLGLPLDQEIVRPLVLTNILPQEQRRKWWKHIQTRSGQEEVAVQIGSPPHSFRSELGTLLKQLASTSESDIDSIFVSSMGSACSMDQIPVYDTIDSLFREPDVLSLFGSFTPIHETLEISAGGAMSTLAARFSTMVFVHLGGGSIEWMCEPATKESLDALEASEAMTRTWNGNSFTMGWNGRGSLWDLPPGDDKSNLARLFRKELTSYSSNPGDVLVVPPNWWHQSCASGRPGIMVVSQRCSAAALPEMIQRIAYKGDFTISGSEDSETLVEKLFASIDDMDA